MAVDDQSGFAIKLLHDTNYVVALPGNHVLTAEGGIAIFASLSEGSCSGAASEDWYYGGALEATYSFTVQLPASSPPHMRSAWRTRLSAASVVQRTATSTTTRT